MIPVQVNGKLRSRVSGGTPCVRMMTAPSACSSCPVARAVVAQPALLIADEPTGNLDIDTSWEMMDLFADIANFGTTVLIATHNVEIVRRFQRRVLTLVHGRLVRDQPAGRTGRMAWLASS